VRLGGRTSRSATITSIRQIAPNVCYSGAIDYTSTNPWGELVEQREAGIPGKGFVVVDLASGSHRFEPLGGTRGFEELPAIAAAGLAPGEIDGQIRERVTSCAGGIDDKVVRLLVRDIPPQVVHALDHKTLRSYKQRALSFFLDTRRPEAARSVTSRAERTRRTLEEIVRENLELRPLEPDVDREKLVALGLGYLKEAEALDTPTSAVELHDNTQGERHEAA
jgi:exonuclease SbcD